MRLYRYTLPLVAPLTLRGVALRQREGLLVRCTDGAVQGWGEAAPLPGFSRETLAEAEAQLTLVQAEGLDCEAALHRQDLYPSVRFALEQAHLSLEAARQGRILAQMLGTPRPVVRLNGLITADQDLETRAGALREAGYPAVKLKVGGRRVDDDIGRVGRLAAALGPAVSIRLDANRGWDEHTARRFAEGVAHLPIEYLEEPVPDLRTLTDYPLPLALDETLAGLEPEDLGPFAGVRAVLLKPTVLGGFARTLRFAEHARRHGMKTVVNGAFESGVGLGGLLALAAVLDDTPAGLDTYRWLATDVLAPSLPLPAPAIAIEGIGTTLRRNLMFIRELTKKL